MGRAQNLPEPYLIPEAEPARAFFDLLVDPLDECMVADMGGVHHGKTCYAKQLWEVVIYATQMAARERDESLRSLSRLFILIESVVLQDISADMPPHLGCYLLAVARFQGFSITLSLVSCPSKDD